MNSVTSCLHVIVSQECTFSTVSMCYVIVSQECTVSTVTLLLIRLAQSACVMLFLNSVTLAVGHVCVNLGTNVRVLCFCYWG